MLIWLRAKWEESIMTLALIFATCGGVLAILQIWTAALMYLLAAVVTIVGAIIWKS